MLVVEAVTMQRQRKVLFLSVFLIMLLFVELLAGMLPMGTHLFLVQVILGMCYLRMLPVLESQGRL